RSASPRGSRARSLWGFFGFSAMGGVGTSRRAMRQPRLLLNLAPLFAGRGRNSRVAGISGEGQGTMPTANSAFAGRRAPHPNPLPAKSGARKQASACRPQPLLSRGGLALGLHFGGVAGHQLFGNC